MAKGVKAKEASAPSPEVLTVPILETVKAAQLQNGLRHRDFQRYRQYCTRRLRRIRKSTKFTHGKGKQYMNKKVDIETATENRLLYLPLYNAERAWGYAMQLKEDDNLDKSENGEDANSRIKFHLNGRLRKAAEWSQRLAEICAVRADVRTSLEAEAYAAYMAGNLAFHREEHVLALDKFSTVHRIYTDLSKVGTSSQKDLFSRSADELQPFIRFCEHRLALRGRLANSTDTSSLELQSSGDGANNALLESKIDLVLLEARKQKVASLGLVEWKQQQLTVPTQEIGLAIVRTTELAAKLDAALDDKMRETRFLDLLSAYDGLLQALKSATAKLEQQAKSGSALVHSDLELLAALEEYARFNKLVKQVERQVFVYQTLKRRFSAQQAGELIHILDMLVQTVGDILLIPGIRELEQRRAAQYSSYQAVFRACRASTVAQTYLQDKKFAEAKALYQYALAFLADAEEILAAQPAAKDDILQQLTKEMHVELSGAVSRTTAQSFLESSTRADVLRLELEQLEVTAGEKEKKVKRRKTRQVPVLLDRQDKFEAGSIDGNRELVKLLPEFRPVPCKPLLFDMAYNEMEFPDLTDRTKTDAEKAANVAATEKEGGGGLFGWFRK
ncbi:signal recognition particle 68 kda protein [Plasmopara halstedii]|uniref:Signal recognition particle subunit SRP68 n=1 Tax=Plasmopara halstedii TaxID=4781 RepID=A0A0P1ADS6_PLAHL|nr:signal recognition particle 68 kda protein [Plasmopara halstedii]CEG38668.1 signal recognition particle 68 kda protein [Plasmopara halstedii]|eukprot:XP_024575037.1 signal recognition particle 68 kda protein [Plasmopara halstedii]